MKQQVMNSIELWLTHQAETEIQEVLVSLMVDSMKEPLMSALPSDQQFAQVPRQMLEMMKDQIVTGVKAQVLVSLRSLINANKENSQIHGLIVRKYFPEDQQEEGLGHVEKYSEAYTQEVEAFYQKINQSNFRDVVMFN